MKKEIKTAGAPAAPGLLSQAIEMDGLVITSGQIHLTPDGNLIDGSIEEKTRQVMNNLKEILAAAGLSFADVLKVTVYVTNMAEYGDFNKVYKTYFEEPLPAREGVCVKELPLGASLEISMIAKKKS
jgi:2-iminobutanoate/2-iminopropanoate deaminase